MADTIWGNMLAVQRLPPDVLSKASLRGNEYAWPVDEIPSVIEAAHYAGLVNIGGQLQFRAPEGTCECYWVEVDTFKSVPKTLPHEERVERTAVVALTEFNRLRKELNFIAEGRSAFADVLGRYEAQGGALSEIMCYVWYVSDN